MLWQKKRFRHFAPNSVTELLKKWQCDKVEKIRRLIDLVTVSVLLDAGAGKHWKYVDTSGIEHRRSEGLFVRRNVLRHFSFFD